MRSLGAEVDEAGEWLCGFVRVLVLIRAHSALP